MHIHTCTCVYTHIHSWMHIYSHINTCKCKSTHIYTCADTRAHIQVYTHMHACTHIYTTLTHKHAYTHKASLVHFCKPSFCSILLQPTASAQPRVIGQKTVGGGEQGCDLRSLNPGCLATGDNFPSWILEEKVLEAADRS